MQRRVAFAIGIAGLLLTAGLVAQQHQPPAGHKPDHMEHRFDETDRWAREFDDPARDAWQLPGRVVEALALKPGQSIADIGAGTGYFAMRLATSPAAPTVYAVDIEQAMVDHLTMRAAKEGLKNVTAVRASAESPNIPAPVDTVLIVDTYHHIGDRVAYFRKLKASLKPQGRLAIIDFRKDAQAGPPPEFRFTQEQIAAELAQAGFRLVTVHAFLPRQLFLVFRAE